MTQAQRETWAASLDAIEAALDSAKRSRSNGNAAMLDFRDVADARGRVLALRAALASLTAGTPGELVALVARWQEQMRRDYPAGFQLTAASADLLAWTPPAPVATPRTDLTEWQLRTWKRIHAAWPANRTLLEQEEYEAMSAPSVAPVVAPAPESEPPHGLVLSALRQATYSPCQSHRGVVVFHRATLDILARGFNRKPLGFACDGSDACKATCRLDAVHAEQDALIGARVSLAGADLVHVKAVDGALVASGGPSCVACSKLIVEAGIAGVWLFHVDGWKRYTAAEFHQLSLAASRAESLPAAPTAVETPETVTVTRAQLAKIEWAGGSDGDGIDSCPVCQRRRFYHDNRRNHRANCWLAAALTASPETVDTTGD